MEIQDGERLTMTVREASKLIGVSHVTLFNEINNGNFPHIKVGHRTLIPKSSLKKYLENAGSKA